MGLDIGATVIAMVLSPLGQQSGGHFNPALTLALYRLGKLKPWDALFYSTAQFLGAIAGVTVAKYVLGGAPGNDAVRYAVTMPGMNGNSVAFVREHRRPELQYRVQCGPVEISHRVRVVQEIQRQFRSCPIDSPPHTLTEVV